MPRPRMFDRQGLIEAFEAIGAALTLASNVRFATEDVDIAEIGARNGWSPDWLNDAVTRCCAGFAPRSRTPMMRP